MIARTVRWAGRFVTDWRNGATLIASVLVALLVVQTLDGITARRQSLRVAVATAEQAKSAQKAATRRIDGLQRIIAGQAQEIADNSADQAALRAGQAALAEQIRQMGGQPVISPSPARRSYVVASPSPRSSTSPRPRPSSTPTPTPQPTSTCRPLPVLGCG